jgi:hypothetical protein
MTAPGFVGPREQKPTGRARVRASVIDDPGLFTPAQAPHLNVSIAGRETIATTRLPIGEVLARVHTADLLAELQRRMSTDNFPVFCDWLMNRGDALGAALAIFTEQLAALRRERKPPTTGKGRPSGASSAAH